MSGLKVKNLSFLVYILFFMAFHPASTWCQSAGPLAGGLPVSSSPQGPSLPTPSAFRVALPEDYRLGPGDLLDIVLAGRLDVTRHGIVVSPEGYLSMPENLHEAAEHVLMQICLAIGGKKEQYRPDQAVEFANKVRCELIANKKKK